jgi:hypothetical protein
VINNEDGGVLAYTIGYWARCCNLTLSTVQTHKLGELYLQTPKDLQEFQEGWEVAEYEHTSDRLPALEEKLREIGVLP